MTAKLTKREAVGRVKVSLPALEARMRAEFHAYYRTMKRVVGLRAAEGAPKYGKRRKAKAQGDVA